MTGKEVIYILKQNGWVVDRITGSHYIMIKEGLRAVPIPVHGKRDLPSGLVSALERQTQIRFRKTD